MTFAFGTRPVFFALSAFSNAALMGLGFLKLCLSKDLRSKQGPICFGRVLDPETVPVLCFREVALWAPSASLSDQVGPGALSCPVASSHPGTASLVPTSCALPRPSMFVRACLCTSNATFRPLLPTRLLPVCVPVSLQTSIYGVTPAEGYLLFNLFVEGPQQPCSSRPLGVGRQWLCVDPRSDPTCVCRRMDLYSG